jgi:hypothetical protein
VLSELYRDSVQSEEVATLGDDLPSNSALESASGPSDNSRSRGLSSGGSCLMVYLRVPTAVFYIIQAIGFSTLQHAASARQHFSLGALQHSWVSGLDGFGWTCGRGGDS